MKKVFLLMAVLFATAINSYAQELKIVDGFYKSGFYLQSNGLTIDEIVAAIEMDEMGTGTLDLVYKNEKANVFVVELSFNYMKDTIGRWISLVVPCKCFLRGESVKVVVENLQLEAYKSLETTQTQRSAFERAKGVLTEEVRVKIEPVVKTCREDIDAVLKKAVTYWKE